MNKPEFTFCDLVRVNGYWPRVFQVDGYREEHWHYIDEDYRVVIYELYDCGNNEWIEAEESDLTLVADAGQADEYLAANPVPVEPSTSFINYAEIIGMEGAVNMAKQGGEPRKPTARELSAIEAEERKMLRKLHAEVVDDLLDQLRDNMALYEMFGDAEFGDKVFAIKAELKKLTEKD